MTTQNRIKTVLTLAVVAIAILAGSARALECQLGILTPETLAGVNPATGASWKIGDQYRFVFHTSATTTATSADIATYNAWVQGLADASTAYDIGAADGATWKVIGSTADVNALDNTSTHWTEESPGHPIYLLDGSTLVASSYADLWDGSIQHIIDINEAGGPPYAYWPWTGTMPDGTARNGGANGSPLGGPGEVGQGNASSTTDWVWRTWTMDPATNQLPMYALSDPLVIVGEIDPNIPDVDAGVDMITWSGEPVQLDPNVVEKEGSDWTALTYLWSAVPADGVEFSNANTKAPTVTITKATDNPSVVRLTLAVNNEGRIEPPITDSMKIYVYDDACVAAAAVGPIVIDRTDIDENCVTNFVDFALLAATWLDDYKPTGPAVKPEP